MLFQQIQIAIQQRSLLCVVEHIRTYSNLPSKLTECNALIDKLIIIINLSHVYLAQLLHALHYQNSVSLENNLD